MKVGRIGEQWIKEVVMLRAKIQVVRISKGHRSARITT